MADFKDFLMENPQLLMFILLLVVLGVIVLLGFIIYWLVQALSIAL